MLTLAYCFMIVLSSCIARDSHFLQAFINSKGIEGQVYFYQYRYQPTIIYLRKLKMTPDRTYAIYEHPTTSKDTCADIGKKLYDLHKTRTIFTWNDYIAINIKSKINLQGKSSIQGRSLVILNSKGDKLACAPILSRDTGNKYAVAAISTDKIAGKIEFIQQGIGETVITGQISHSDGTTVPTSNHKMYITSDYTSEMTPKCPKTLNLDNIYNPTKTTEDCDENTPNMCKVGDLVGKHGPINIGITGNKRFTMVDSNLPLNGASSVLKRLVVITSHLDPEKVLGCGIIMQRGPLQADAKFKVDSSKGISGRVSFSQDSPYHDTVYQAYFSGLNRRAGGYHVHKFPISDVSNPCGQGSVGGHWNPYNVDATKSPQTGKGTFDQYESGDLSRKFGYLNGAQSVHRYKRDNNLPMFGRDTLIGRSVVIHSGSGSRIACADIVPRNSLKVEGRLDFTRQDETLNGFISLTQYRLPNGIMTPTLVVVSLGYKGNPNKKTVDHKFHVHVNAIGNDKQRGGKCKSTLGHYNPYSVSLTNYKQQCNKDFQYRCEVGDLSSKHGTYDIGGGKTFSADENIPLLGDYSVIGRSIVFHGEKQSAPRIACADIKKIG